MQLEQPVGPEIEKKVMVTVPGTNDLENWFTYHPPTEDLLPRYKAIRDAALEFAKVVHTNAAAGPDKTVAIRCIREAVMWANASIACFKSPDKELAELKEKMSNVGGKEA